MARFPQTMKRTAPCTDTASLATQTQSFDGSSPLNSSRKIAVKPVSGTRFGFGFSSRFSKRAILTLANVTTVASGSDFLKLCLDSPSALVARKSHAAKAASGNIAMWNLANASVLLGPRPLPAAAEKGCRAPALDCSLRDTCRVATTERHEAGGDRSMKTRPGCQVFRIRGRIIYRSNTQRCIFKSARDVKLARPPPTDNNPLSERLAMGLRIGGRHWNRL